MPPYAIRPLTPEAVYTDRREFLDYFYDYALQARTRRAMSTVLLGKRRMGKTEIFKRVVNRLFFEQDHADPDAVVPVYYLFQDRPIDLREFALEYAANFLRWLAAFRTRNLDVLAEQISHTDLLAYIRSSVPFSKGIESALKTLETFVYDMDGVTLPHKWALMLPRTVSDRDETSIVMFLDEFQNTRLPHYEFDIVGLMQEAVESPTCPHFVTGSAVSILSKEILGRGALFGRFRSEPIHELSAYWGAELARCAAEQYQVALDPLVAPVLAERCGGNPFYITAVVQQAAYQRQAIPDEAAVNNLLGVDLSSGFIWAELNDQVMRWIQRVNDYEITKWVLYLSALEEGEWIDPARIQQHLRDKEGKEVGLDLIRDVLIRLSRGDLLDYLEISGRFRKVEDPILLDFLKAWGKFEVQGQSREHVIEDAIKQYDALQRRFNDQKGYVAEMYLAQILWNAQRTTLPGRYFHSDQDVTLPHRFYTITTRRRLDAASDREVDVYAFASREIWLVESKWWETRKVGAAQVREFLELAEAVKDAEKRAGYDLFTSEDPYRLQLWLFAHNGVTKEAERLLRKHGIYWSTRADLDALIQLTGLRKLPEVV